MDTLSMEPVYNIALNLDPYTLSQLCLTDRRYAGICNDEYFWKTKFERDYPGVIPVMKSEFISWKEYYRSYYTDVLIMIKANGNYFDLIDYQIMPKKLAEYVLRYFKEIRSIDLCIAKHDCETFTYKDDLNITINESPSDIKCFKQLFGRSHFTITIIDLVIDTYIEILSEDVNRVAEMNELERIYNYYLKIK